MDYLMNNINLECQNLILFILDDCTLKYIDMYTLKMCVDLSYVFECYLRLICMQ